MMGYSCLIPYNNVDVSCTGRIAQHTEFLRIVYSIDLIIINRLLLLSLWFTHMTREDKSLLYNHVIFNRLHSPGFSNCSNTHLLAVIKSS